MSFNPNYIAYSRVHGNTPDEQLKADEIAWPGGIMCGFILWINQQKQEFLTKHPEHFLDQHTIGNIKAWGEFLQQVSYDQKTVQ